MPRTPRLPAPIATPALDADLVSTDLQSLDMNNARLVDVDSTYGSGLPYDLNRVVHEYQIHVGNASSFLIDAGKCVILIHEHEPRGEFERVVDERLGISRRSAYRFMAATRRLLALTPKSVPALAQIGQTKLLELMVEADDEDLESLAEGGSIAGMTLDKIEGMTSRELRARLREQSEKLEVKDRQLEAKDKKINDLDAELSAKPAPVYHLDEALEALDKQTRAIVASILASQRRAVLDVMGEGTTHDLSRSARQQIGAAMGRIILAVRDVAADLDLDVNESPKQDTDSDDDIWAAVNAEMAAKAAGHDAALS